MRCVRVFSVGVSLVTVVAAFGAGSGSRRQPPQAVRNAAASLSNSRGALKEGPRPLSGSLRSASVDRNAYLTRTASGTLLILFPTWRGKGANLEGYLFCKSLLRSGDTHPDPSGNGQQVIEVYTPSPASQPVRNEVVLERKLDAHWYRVSRGVD